MNARRADIRHGLGPVSIVVFLILIFASIVSRSSAETIDPAGLDPVMKTILENWGHRQESIRSLYVHWSENRFYAAGAIAHPQNPRERQPQQDTENVKDKIELWIDEGKLNYSRDASTWSWDERRFVRQQYVSATNGAISHIFWPAGISLPNATIFPDAAHADLRNLNLRPLLWSVRPLHEMLGPYSFRPDQWRVLPAAADADESLIVLNRSVDNRSERIMHVDSSRDYAITHLRMEREGIIHWQLDVDLQSVALNSERMPDAVILPAGWTIVWLTDGVSVRESVTAVVEELIVNPSIPAEIFDPILPAGTEVNDLRRKLAPSPVPPAKPLAWRGMLVINLTVGIVLVVMFARGKIRRTTER